MPTLLTALLGLAPAAAADLPGVPLSFDVTAEGRWVLPQDLPARFSEAGVQPGWPLVAVDGLSMDLPDAVRRRVADGPARAIQLEFDTDEGEVVVVVRRSPLVRIEEVGLLPWPAGYAVGTVDWYLDRSGKPRLMDGAGSQWMFDPRSGAQTPLPKDTPEAELRGIPGVWWELSDADWALVRGESVEVRQRDALRQRFTEAARVTSFQGGAGDHLLLPTHEGLEVYSVGWPGGVPGLPECTPEVPETCLVAGREVAATLLDRRGGRDEALRNLGLACDAGVYRACLEAVVLEEPHLAEVAGKCGARDVNACHDIGRRRLERDPDASDALMIGVLEYACDVDASGSLGERLRRLEDVGEGCVMLAAAHDRAAAPDRALISLDQACMLGRVDACEEASQRRADAFALKTARECEAPDLPLASSCVQLGDLLQDGPLSATELDGFGAYLRACELGEEDGCKRLGDYVDRWGIEHTRVVSAERELRSACDRGEQRACVGTAHLLVRHEPRTDAYGQALELFAAACAEGQASGCIAGAEQRRIGTARKAAAPEPEAMWQTACDLGSTEGCTGLGERLSRSRKAWDRAFTAWTQACDNGGAAACTDLGRFVTEKHDPAWPGEQPADDYLTRGCDNGDAEGCFWLAENDLPKKGDPPEPAYLLLEQSCDGDFGLACATLGEVHLQRKTSFDDEIAAGRLESACDNGHFESCKELGGMYQRGQGVEKDRVRAREFRQRFSVNAERKHARLGLHLGFPYIAGAEAELVAPIPAGPALSITGSYSYMPKFGGVMEQLVGEEYPANLPDLWYVDAGVRLYPNNKARGIYVMAGVHQIEAIGGDLSTPLTRQGPSARFGMYNENNFVYTRVEMGIAQYGLIHLADFDEDETSSFPLIQATLGVSVGLAGL